MTPAQAEATAAKLIPRLNRTKTCQSFCRVIVRNVERPHRRRVAWVAIRLLGKTWAVSTVNGWLREKAHTKEGRQKRVAANRRWKARRRAQRRAERASK